eukprot:4653249-Ditylum_brightwellii.AAC.1
MLILPWIGLCLGKNSDKLQALTSAGTLSMEESGIPCMLILLPGLPCCAQHPSVQNTSAGQPLIPYLGRKCS